MSQPGRPFDPAKLRGLIAKGDQFAQDGDGRAASSFYRAALRSAPPPQMLPPDLVAELRRAAAACDAYARQFETFLLERLASEGFDAKTSSARFAQSIDLMLGKKQIFLQQPTQYYFPELPQIQFYERKHFPWMDGLEAAAGDIRAELLEIMEEEGAFVPYVEYDPSRPRIENDAGLTANPNWSACYLWKNGVLQEENARRFPKTLRALEGVPLASIPGRTPSVLFSRLLPGAHIPPHTGFINTRLICHLGLVVPENCAFRVGNDVREWVEGKCWAFDDTIQHEAWNRSQKTRIILLFEIWRPELDAEERRLVTSFLRSVDAYGGKREDWKF